MDYIISINNIKNTFEPEKIIRLQNKTIEYVEGYKEAIIKQNKDCIVYYSKV